MGVGQCRFLLGTPGSWAGRHLLLPNPLGRGTLPDSWAEGVPPPLRDPLGTELREQLLLGKYLRFQNSFDHQENVWWGRL